MPKIKYQDIDIGPARLSVIAKANEIIAEYRAQGFDLTLRQLYYQFVARALIANKQSEYKKLGDIINDARLAGLVDWLAIVDRTRNLKSISAWESPESIVEAVAQQYKIDLWETQPHRVEVWIEKDALVGVIEDICTELRVPYFSCRGYTSQSEMWSAAQRLIRYEGEGQKPIILHFGDHDPSGKDMSRDIADRLALFGTGAEVRRLALNMDQIDQYNPPPNPTKLTDSRADGYIAEFGHESWELDALEPAVIADLVRNEVDAIRDDEKYDEAKEREETEKSQLEAIHQRYDDVTEFLGV